jgi:hypothetical protein
MNLTHFTMQFPHIRLYEIPLIVLDYLIHTDGRNDERKERATLVDSKQG